jgi:hypothetical protein
MQAIEAGQASADKAKRYCFVLTEEFDPGSE